MQTSSAKLGVARDELDFGEELIEKLASPGAAARFRTSARSQSGLTSVLVRAFDIVKPIGIEHEQVAVGNRTLRRGVNGRLQKDRGPGSTCRWRWKARLPARFGR